MKLKPFNVADFISNEETPVCTRYGHDVEILKTNCSGNSPVLFYINGRTDTARKNGEYFPLGGSLFDLFFKKTKWKPKYGDEIFIPYVPFPDSPSKIMWLDCTEHKDFFKKGIVCRTREEAIKLAHKMIAVAKEYNV